MKVQVVRAFRIPLELGWWGRDLCGGAQVGTDLLSRYMTFTGHQPPSSRYGMFSRDTRLVL